MGDKWERIGEVEILTCGRTVFSHHIDRKVSLVRGESSGQSDLRVEDWLLKRLEGSGQTAEINHKALMLELNSLGSPDSLPTLFKLGTCFYFKR